MLATLHLLALHLEILGYIPHLLNIVLKFLVEEGSVQKMQTVANFF